ncbi:MAG: hypothetical protein RLZZ612_1009 [Pseudomonadota bacterium]
MTIGGFKGERLHRTTERPLAGKWKTADFNWLSPTPSGVKGEVSVELSVFLRHGPRHWARIHPHLAFPRFPFDFVFFA